MIEGYLVLSINYVMLYHIELIWQGPHFSYILGNGMGQVPGKADLE